MPLRSSPSSDPEGFKVFPGGKEVLICIWNLSIVLPFKKDQKNTLLWVDLPHHSTLKTYWLSHDNISLLILKHNWLYEFI